MHICIFEDESYRKLLPLVHFRPVYELKCGMTSLREKIVRRYPEAKQILHIRDYLAFLTAERCGGAHVNIIPKEAEEVLFINGRLLMSAEDKKMIGEVYPGGDIVFWKGQVVVAAWLTTNNLERIKASLKNHVLDGDLFQTVTKKEMPQAQIITYPWELISYNGAQLISDFRIATDGKPQIVGKVFEGAHLINPSQIQIGEGASVKPGAVLDAEKGPIYISENVKIMPNAVIEGPAFVGADSVAKIGAKIYENTTIGEKCKVGGEVEESIVHAYSNKQHEGFIGHSYLGEWINIGADSNNSDLKNDYGNVKAYNDGVFVDTGMQFVGLIMGDHSKCGINSMFNTGTVVSVCCNIFGAGIPPKYIPAYTWGGASDGLVTYKIDKAVEVARTVMKRRDIVMSAAAEQLFKKVFALTMGERAAGGIRDTGD